MYNTFILILMIHFSIFFFMNFLNYPPLKFYNSSETGPVYLITSFFNDEKLGSYFSLDYFLLSSYFTILILKELTICILLLLE